MSLWKQLTCSLSTQSDKCHLQYYRERSKDGCIACSNYSFHCCCSWRVYGIFARWDWVMKIEPWVAFNMKSRTGDSSFTGMMSKKEIKLGCNMGFVAISSCFGLKHDIFKCDTNHLIHIHDVSSVLKSTCSDQNAYIKYSVLFFTKYVIKLCLLMQLN